MQARGTLSATEGPWQGGRRDWAEDGHPPPPEEGMLKRVLNAERSEPCAGTGNSVHSGRGNSNAKALKRE